MRQISEGLPVYTVLVDSSMEAVLYKSIRKMIWNCDIDLNDLLQQIWQAKTAEDNSIKTPNLNNQIYKYTISSKRTNQNTKHAD